MEISGFRHHVSYPGEEKYEMLELNKRLESYLNHVKLLEEENKLLCGEIQAMRRNQDSKSQWKAQEEAISLARKELQNAWRAKDCVELEVSNLLEEMEELNILRQKEKSAHVEAKKKLEESKRALEEERRMQIWLRKQAAHLEKEIAQQVQVHHEDMTALKSSCAFSKPVQMVSEHSQTLNLQGLGEEYSQRAAQVWREAAGSYQTQMKRLEESLDQTRAQMTLLKEEKKQSQLQVQDLAKELDSTKAKRELLEKNMVEQRQRQSQDLQHLQAYVEDLEAGKLELGDQIGELLLESRNLLQMKMSLSLEVATYRTLLDSESLRYNNPSASTRNRTISLLEGITKSPGIPPGSQASFCLFSTPLNTTRSITHKANLMTPTPTWNPTLRSPHETPRRPQTTKKEEVIVKAEEKKLETATTILKKHLIEPDPHDHYKAEEKAGSAASVSASEIPEAVYEPILTGNVKEDLKEVLEAEPGLVSFSTNEKAIITLPIGHPRTPEDVSSGHHIEKSKSSEDGDEEETLVSTEMSQISHAPVSAWEENETVIPEVRDIVSALELESEDVPETNAQEIIIDADQAELQLLCENTNEPVSLLQDIPHLSAHTFIPVEEQENSSHLHGTRKVNEQQTSLTMQVNITEDASKEYRDDAENWNKESIEIHPGGKSEDKKYVDTSLLEPSHEQTLEEEPCKKASTEITHSDVLLFETAITEEQAYSHYRAEEEANSAASVSVSEVPEAVYEPILTGNVKEDLQEVLEPEPGLVSFSTNETTIITLPVGHPESPEDVSSGHHIEEARSSEDGDEEETEVSTEMAQISHAPVSAWEENETVIPEKREAVSALELELEGVPETNTQEIIIDADQAELQLLCENTNEPASLLQDIPHLSADTFSPVEDDSEILTWGDVKEDVIHFVEEESLKCSPEVDRKSGKQTEKVEDEMEAEQDEWPGIEALESLGFDIKVQEEENETEKHDKKVEQSNEEELTNGEEERMIEEDKVCEQKAELVMSAHGKDNLVREQAEEVMDTFTKDNQVGEKTKAVMVTFDKDQLVEHNAEEDQGQTDEDESLNISASWRTDPGDADSYAQENTIADTRPLIHYKSDDETDANIPTAHLGASEPIDSEEEREKHEGSSHWSHIIAKRFDTMEDLSEEPELGSMDDMVTDESVQSVLRQSMDEESVVQNERGEMKSHVETLMDDALEDQSESDHRNNSNENSQEETKSYQLSTFPFEEQEDSSHFHGTREVNEQQTSLTMQVNISGDASIEYREDVENWNKESIEIHPGGKSEDKTDFDTSLLEPSHEQTLEEERCEEASTEITHSDVLLFETAITEEQACPKEEDVQSNLSMLTHADFTDEFYLHSFPGSQTNINDSDLEEPNSSEDESLNLSQNSQLLSQQLDQDSATIMDVDSNADPLFTGLVSDVLNDENSEDCYAPQAEGLENKEEKQYAADSSISGLGENASSIPQEWENLGHESTSASRNIAEEFGDEETDSKKDNMEILQGVALKEKENDLHSFFSSSIKDGIWSERKFEMAATYDPNDQTETERYTHQTMAFGEDWENPERLPPTNSKPEKDRGSSIAQSTEDDEEEQEITRGKQVQCRDVKDRDEETVHAADSTDEGDSWSSGEE